MILGFSTKHPDGTPTRFEIMITAAFGENVGAAIVPGLKMHTCRVYDPEKGRHWKEGDLIHFTTGARTPKQRTFRVAKCTGVEIVRMGIEEGRIFVELEERRMRIDPIQFAKNDGLPWGQFLSWFEKELSKGDKLYQVIHWTQLRYG